MHVVVPVAPVVYLYALCSKVFFYATINSSNARLMGRMASVHTRSTFGFFDFFVDDDDEFVDAVGAGFPVSVSWRVASLCVSEYVRVGGLVESCLVLS